MGIYTGHLTSDDGAARAVNSICTLPLDGAWAAFIAAGGAFGAEGAILIEGATLNERAEAAAKVGHENDWTFAGPHQPGEWTTHPARWETTSAGEEWRPERREFVAAPGGEWQLGCGRSRAHIAPSTKRGRFDVWVSGPTEPDTDDAEPSVVVRYRAGVEAVTGGEAWVAAKLATQAATAARRAEAKAEWAAREAAGEERW